MTSVVSMALGFAAGFLTISWYLGVSAGAPIAMRTDVFFQSDAGVMVNDAVTGFNGRARGTHPLIYPLWTKPLHALCIALAPAVDPHVTATLASRALVAIVAGLGLAVLVRRFHALGVPRGHLLIFGVLLLVANAHALAAIPDHFGLSLGILSAAFASALAPWSVRRKMIMLILFALVAAGITVTNIFFPLGLLAWQALAHFGTRIPRRWILAVSLLILAAFLALIAAVQRKPDAVQRLRSRIELYLNWRIVEEPLVALTYSARGIMDCAVGPTPVASSIDNLDGTPMLTNEPAGQPYRLWPYNAVQSAGVIAWLLLLVIGSFAALREPATRGAALVLWGWAIANLAFHNLWGDEFFLYTPHYFWALLTVTVLGWQHLPQRFFAVLAALVATAALGTLATYRELLQTIPL